MSQKSKNPPAWRVDAVGAATTVRHFMQETKPFKGRLQAARRAVLEEVGHADAAEFLVSVDCVVDCLAVMTENLGAAVGELHATGGGGPACIEARAQMRALLCYAEQPKLLAAKRWAAGRMPQSVVHASLQVYWVATVAHSLLWLLTAVDGPPDTADMASAAPSTLGIPEWAYKSE